MTPTYFRAEQKADLIRLSQTLLHIPKLHWIIIEDSPVRSEWIDKFLRRTKSLSNGRGFDFTHLNEITPQQFKIKPRDPSWRWPRGVWQRNEGLRALRDTSTFKTYDDAFGGVVYFADDDNTYDLRLFEDIRNTKLVSIFPVGIVGGLFVEKPLVKNNRVVAFNARFKPERLYPVDMAGFAINLKLIREKKDVVFIENAGVGMLETTFLESILEGRHQLEPKANQCTNILVWHTKTAKSKIKLDSNFSSNYFEESL